MAWFGLGKKKDVLDLTERYRKQQEKLKEIKDDSESSSDSSPVAGAFGIFGGSSSASQTSSSGSNYVDVSSSVEEKRKKLAKRLVDITDKLEDLSNQIYHLQQRVEVLEKKSGAGY